MSFISIRWLLIKIFVGGILFLALIVPSRGQVQQTSRFEIPINDRSEFFNIISSSDNGLFMQRQLSGPQGDQRHLIKLDTAFSQQWSGFIDIEKNYRVFGRHAFSNRLFILLRYNDYSRNDLILLAIDATTGTFTRYQIRG